MKWFIPWYWQARIDSNEDVVVGVNKYRYGTSLRCSLCPQSVCLLYLLLLYFSSLFFFFFFFFLSSIFINSIRFFIYSSLLLIFSSHSYSYSTTASPSVICTTLTHRKPFDTSLEFLILNSIWMILTRLCSNYGTSGYQLGRKQNTMCWVLTTLLWGKVRSSD